MIALFHKAVAYHIEQKLYDSSVPDEILQIIIDLQILVLFWRVRPSADRNDQGHPLIITPSMAEVVQYGGEGREAGVVGNEPSICVVSQVLEMERGSRCVACHFPHKLCVHIENKEVETPIM